MIILSLLAAVLGAAATWIQGGGWLDIAVAYMLSGWTGFVVLAILATLRGAPEPEADAVDTEMLALRETSEGQRRPTPDVILRNNRLHAQMRSRLPRSAFGG